MCVRCACVRAVECAFYGPNILYNSNDIYFEYKIRPIVSHCNCSCCVVCASVASIMAWLPFGILFGFSMSPLSNVNKNTDYSVSMASQIMK